jgi:putative ATP-binding cassette transporter
VPLTHTHALFGPRFARHLTRLTRLYWTSPDAPKGFLLLAATVALELGTVYGNVLLSDVQRRIFDAFQDKQMAAFTSAIALFLGVALGFVLVSTYRIYLRQALEIRWRHWLTDHFIKEWISSHAYCQIELHRKATDNPDQRIAEDVREYVASALGLSLSLLSAVATLVSFAAILWRLSGSWKFQVDGNHIQIPGLMMWVAILYAVIATFVTHRVGRSLAGIQFDRQRFEADFRFKLVRFRENVEPIALANGEGAERRFALERFQHVIRNWWQLIGAQRNLILLTTGIGQANSLVPLLVAAPGFFAGHLTLGSVMQTRIAYGEVSGGLTWFVNAYQEIARWRANIERIVTLAEEIESTRDELERTECVHVERALGGSLRLDHVRLARPDGAVLIEDANAELRPGDRVALVGPMGSGKRTLLRAIAGIWRFGKGIIEVPAHTRTLILSQRPHLPIGTLREVVSYPEPAGTFPDERIREVLRLLDLGALADRLDETEHWQQHLSGGEQQRLALARAFLIEPDWIFLDEATSGLDEETEARVYQLFRERLPRAAIVSIADRPAIAQYHGRRWSLAAGAGGAVLEAA